MALAARSTGPDRPPGTSPTGALAEFASGLQWSGLPDNVRHAAKRHLLDTLGAMIGGAQTDLTDQAEAVLAAVRPPGRYPVPGRARHADLLDAAYLCAIAAHGIELDDGYRQGALHPGCTIVSALLPLAIERQADGRSLLTAMVAGYEVLLAIARASHPGHRKRGYHPTATIGTFGAAAAAAKLLGLGSERIASTLGLAASSAAGLHAYVNGGAEVKRLHAGHAAREGLQAALLAEAGIDGPPGVLEGKDGFFQTLTSGADRATGIGIPGTDDFLIGKCYLKPYPCCRHLQPAATALIALATEQDLRPTDIDEILVETYMLAAEFAEMGWGDFASAQLSFRYIMALAVSHRAITLQHFEPKYLADPGLAELGRKVRVVVADDMDRAYPGLRPARVTVSTRSGRFVKQVDEAPGAPEFPLSDDEVSRKFLGLTAPVLGGTRAETALVRLWALDGETDIAGLLNELAAVRRSVV